MAGRKTGLGRGLNALMNAQPGEAVDHAAEKSSARSGSRSSSKTATKKAGSAAKAEGAVAEAATQEGAREILLTEISVNPYQPRNRFEEEALEELSASVAELGILSPLLVRKRSAGGFELVAGERRYRAAQKAGLKQVPVLVREFTDLESLEVALVENLQRQDLNAIEEAEGYQRLIDEFGLTQESVAQRVGKARASVANALRLLKLVPPVRKLVADGTLSQGHAKALMGLELPEEQELLALECVKAGWSVRETERQVRLRLTPRGPVTASPPGLTDIPPEHLKHLVDTLHQHFGTQVKLIPTQTRKDGSKSRGRLEIDFYNNDDLDRLLSLFGLQDAF